MKVHSKRNKWFKTQMANETKKSNFPVSQNVENKCYKNNY